MKYNSTRNKNTVVTAAQAISQGISEEGGLFVPQELPKYSADELLALSKLDYKGRAKKILADFLSDFTAEEISESVDAAYAAENSAAIILLLFLISIMAMRICISLSFGMVLHLLSRIWHFRFFHIF